MQESPNRTNKNEEEALLTFLQKTKEGEFTEIKPVELTYLRVNELTESDYQEEAYFFSYG